MLKNIFVSNSNNIKIVIVIIISISMIFSFIGCKKQTTKLENEENKIMYKKITPEEAHNIIENQSDYIILDVRNESEFEQGHIENAILIPNHELLDKVGDIIPDKNKQILVYCRSGSRSAISAKKLIQAGYTNVLDFGGLMNWPYDIVQ